ncbi:MAG TPA: GDP-mannose 4,6-dehydratase [Bacteroidota bacterium]|nr:GDP-mannose 4,6-dehydratase [Bacteroidota bacterium]
MNVFITGIDGFVGTHFARALEPAGGYRIFGTVRRREQSSPSSSAVTLFEADITDKSSFNAALAAAKPRKIVHLAAQTFVPDSLKSPADTFQTNILGTLNLLEAVRLNPELRDASVLIVSSGEVYGKVSSASLPITEQTALNPANPYAASKACADLIAQQYRKSFGMDVTVVRPFNHIGPGQSDSFVSAALAKQIVEIKLGKREPKIHVGNLDPQRDFTDVRDVVRAYIALLNLPKRDTVYNVCSGVGVPIRRLLDLLIELSGVRVEIVPDPALIRSNETPVIIGSAEALRTATGWKPEIALKDTLRDLLAYWEDKLRAAA